MAEPRTINLAEACGELPGGHEYAMTYHGSLTLTVEGVMSWTDGMHWGVRVEKPTTTKSGRKGKPEPVVLLVANDGQTIPDLLRSIATMWDRGEVEVGKNYPADPGAGGS